MTFGRSAASDFKGMPSQASRERRIRLWRRLPFPKDAPDPAAVYVIYTGNVMLRAGYSTVPVTRLGNYVAKEWFRTATRITVQWYPFRDEAAAAECLLLADQVPKFNTEGVLTDYRYPPGTAPIKLTPQPYGPLQEVNLALFFPPTADGRPPRAPAPLPLLPLADGYDCDCPLPPGFARIRHSEAGPVVRHSNGCRRPVPPGYTGKPRQPQPSTST